MNESLLFRVAANIFFTVQYFKFVGDEAVHRMFDELTPETLAEHISILQDHFELDPDKYMTEDGIDFDLLNRDILAEI